MGKIKFGTDGWRAVISEDFTFDNVRIVAQAVSDYVNANKKNGETPRLIVGYDYRFLSEKYAELVSRVLLANGIEAILTDRATPTPAISFAIKNKKLSGGVMITASHNPAEYNGIKYKAYYGGSAGTDIISAIEAQLSRNPVKSVSKEEMEKSPLFGYENVCPAHLKFIKSYIKWDAMKKARYNVLVDAMHGSAYEFIADMLAVTRCKVTTIRSNRDALFGGNAPEPNEKHLGLLSREVRKGKYDIGIATDGDVDRVAIVGPDGKVLTGHTIMALYLLHLVEDRREKGGVVQTICGTVLINKICKKYGLKMYETPVGFKYICDLMLKEDILLGGEETGGIGFKDYIPERDGVMSGLLMLEMMAFRKKTLPQIIAAVKKEYGSYCYQRMDLVYPEEMKAPLMKILKEAPPKDVLGIKVLDIKDLDGIKLILEDESWLMLRLSGTEPKVRIYSEASTDKRAIRMLDVGKDIAFAVRK